MSIKQELLKAYKEGLGINDEKTASSNQKLCLSYMEKTIDSLQAEKGDFFTKEELNNRFLSLSKDVINI